MTKPPLPRLSNVVRRSSVHVYVMIYSRVVISTSFNRSDQYLDLIKDTSTPPPPPGVIISQVTVLPMSKGHRSYNSVGVNRDKPDAVRNEIGSLC